MKLLVVVVCYKVVDLTIECLAALEAEVQSTPGTRVAVCENGTGGDSVSRLERAILENGWNSWVDLTSIMPNRGFTGGNNCVLAPALAGDDPPEYVLLLNADTIVQPHALGTLLSYMDGHPDVGIGGSRLENPDGTWQGSPFRFFSVASEFEEAISLGIVSRLLGHWRVVPQKPATATKVDWVSGASMIIRRQVLDEVGLLDEGLYTYFDDIDICWRARKAGWSTWWVPASRITHLEGASTGINARTVKRRPAYWFQARRRFYLKNYGPFYTTCVDAAFILGFATWRLRRFIQRKPDPDPPSFLRDFICHSVFLTGFKLRNVENPAMTEALAPEMACNKSEPRP